MSAVSSTLTRAFEVLLLQLPPHHGSPRAGGVEAAREGAHVQGAQAVRTHGGRGEG